VRDSSQREGFRNQSTDCTLTSWGATLDRSEARERWRAQAPVFVSNEMLRIVRSWEVRLKRGEMTTFPFHRCYKVNCLFPKIKERYRLNDATFSYVPSRVAIVGALKERGNLARNTRAYGNLKMDSGDLDADILRQIIIRITARQPCSTNNYSRTTWRKRVIRFFCLGANDDRTVARQMKVLAFNQTCATASTADLGFL